MEENPASEILQHPSSSGQSRRARKRQKSRLSGMVPIGDINAKGFVFGTEVSCDLTLKCKIGENWPKNQILAQKCPENAPSILMDEIKSVNVGVNFSLDWCALTELRKILAKLALRHSTAPYKYIAWHYASKVGNRRKTRSQNSNSMLEEAFLHNNSNEESRPLVCEKDRLMLLFEYSNQCGGERGNNSGGPQHNNMHESVHPNIILLFLLSSIRHTVPDDIFGSHANKKIFIKQWLPILYEFRGRKSVALGKLMNGVAVSKVHWAREVGSIGGRGKRAYIVSKVWLWLLTQYLACLVSCHFVLVKVSGGNGNGMQEAFFAKRIWQSWTESTVAAHTSPEGMHPKAPLKGWVLTPVPADEKLAIHQSGRCLISNLQFRVKRHGVRPVMKVRFSPEEYTLKKACQALLRYLMNDNAYNDPITRLSITWKKFHSMWKELSVIEKEAQKEPFTYAVKVDIEDAYGSVIHEKIYDILLEKLEKAGLKNDCKVSIKAIKCFKKLPNGKYVYKERHHLEGINIKPTGGQSESSSEWTVKWRKSFQIGCLLSFLKKCISEQFVRDRRQLYHLTQGLVQGSIFSPLLWEIYLHNLVEKHLLPHFSDGPSELICGVDDILFLTGSQEKAEWFLQQMCEGFLAYNVYINPRKISTNLKGRTESEFITFWGFTLDPVTGYAIGHFAGHPGRDLSNTIKLSVLKDPWRLLKSTLLFGNTKLCFLTMNPDYNGKRIVLCNVFRAALLLAARFHAIAKVVLKNLGLHVRVFKRGNISEASFENNIPDCPANVVQPCTSHGIGAKGITKFSNNQILLIAFIKKRVKFLIQCVEKLERKHCLENIETTDEIKWLSYTAFKIILGKSGGYYPEVLKRINLLRKGVAKQMQGEKITELQNIASLCQI